MRTSIYRASIRGFIAIAIVSLLAASCSQQASAPGAGESGAAPAAKSGAADPKNSAVILINAAKLYEEKDGAMVYKTTANIGNVVKWKDSVKNAIRKSDGQEREFAQIEADNENLWIQTLFIAPQAVPGVVVGEETVLYKKADAASPIGRTIPKLTTVGVHSNSAEGGFVAVSAYIDGDKNPVIAKQYVKVDNIVTDASEVRSFQLYSIAMASKDAVVRKELLKSALETKSRFSDLIQGEYDKLAKPAAVASPATEAFSATFTVNIDNVNVRDRPSAVDSSVVSQLSKGAIVTAIERTVAKDTVGEATAHWYKIGSPSGWVFGSFLSE